ncbi:MAG: ATP-binding protein, partial [Deltaproteobacteria bacterium]|nr:ATP-binding protein [Deltaproteobacteria bacterium]
LVVWPRAAGKEDKWGRKEVQKVVIELKVLYKSLEKTISDGLQQILQYMDRCGTDEGHLVIFDRTPSKNWKEKIFTKAETIQEKTIMVWGM